MSDGSGAPDLLPSPSALRLPSALLLSPSLNDRLRWDDTHELTSASTAIPLLSLDQLPSLETQPAPISITPPDHDARELITKPALLHEPTSEERFCSDTECASGDSDLLLDPSSARPVPIDADGGPPAGAATPAEAEAAPAAMDTLRIMTANGNAVEDGESSEDNDWEVDRRSDDDLDSEDINSDDFDFPRRFCTNCTARVPGEYDTCEECGHCVDQDTEIFAEADVSSTSRSRGALPAVLCYDERMTQHEEGRNHPHPERPDRIRAVFARLKAQGLLERVSQLPCREASAEEVGACHTPELFGAVEAASRERARREQEEGEGPPGPAYFTPDTYVNPHTFLCAKLSAGGCVTVATAVARGEASTGIAVVRPPGHHAESNMVMGFCFFNNAAIAARAAQAAGARKVLIMDWDVHHGNGTQHIFEDDSSVLYMSVHRYDGGAFYPGTGAACETGKGAGAGFTVNVPWLEGGMADGDYLAAFNHVVLPIAHEFAPDLLIISAGFDAAVNDPIGGCCVTPQGFAHMASMLKAVAPTVVLLEGGYNLTSTARSVEAVLRVMVGEAPPPLPYTRARCPSPLGMVAIKQAVAAQAPHWACMDLLHSVCAPELEPELGHTVEQAVAAATAAAGAQEQAGVGVVGEAEGLSDNAPGVAAARGARAAAAAAARAAARMSPPPLDEEAKRRRDEAADAATVLSPGLRDMERGLKRQRVAASLAPQRKWQLLNALHLSALKALLRKQARGARGVTEPTSADRSHVM